MLVGDLKNPCPDRVHIRTNVPVRLKPLNTVVSPVHYPEVALGAYGDSRRIRHLRQACADPMQELPDAVENLYSLFPQSLT